MAVRLRLRRMGRKKRPFYRIVAADQRSSRDGRFIESLGYYDPLTDSKNLDLKRDRITYWLEQGAQPSETVRTLLRREGLLHKLELQKRGLDEAAVEEEMKKWEVLQTERAKRREAAAVQARNEKKQETKEKKEAGPAPAPEPEQKKAAEPAVKAETVQPVEEEPAAEAAETAGDVEEPAVETDTAEQQESGDSDPGDDETDEAVKKSE